MLADDETKIAVHVNKVSKSVLELLLFIISYFPCIRIEKFFLMIKRLKVW